MKNAQIRFVLPLLAVAVVLVSMPAQAQTPPPVPTPPPANVPHDDWANMGKYGEADVALGMPAKGEDRVVFMGDSITEGWRSLEHDFPGSPHFTPINRGISGQTTPQMLIRFRPDVIALHPKVVVILGGTNDVAGNTGYMPPEMTEGNLASMAELAHANGIRVVLASVLPASDFPWRRGLQPGPKIAALNAWMRDYAAKNHCVYLDYYTPMVDADLGLKAGLTLDGVHPNPAGYAVMAPLAQRAIAQALHSR
jgi:lysophospholipase L1-like esterase